MYRELTKKDISWASEMLRRINRSAQELFQKAVLDGTIVKAHIYEYDNNIGIVSVLQGEGYYSVQISFHHDVHSYDVLYELEQEIRQMLNVKGPRDVYLNMNVNDSRLSALLRFRLMEEPKREIIQEELKE